VQTQLRIALNYTQKQNQL